MNVTNIAHLQLSQRSGNARDFVIESDVMISVSSWERRCTEILNARIDTTSAVVLRFAEQGNSGRRRLHDDMLTLALDRRTGRFQDLPFLSALDYENWKEVLAQFLIDEYRSHSRRLHISIDSSCCPKSILLFLIAFGIRTGLAYRVTVFYSEGNYTPPEGVVKSLDRYSFTQGDWRSVLVPYLEGGVSPERKTRLIATTGFEAFQARTFIRSYEADAHQLIVASPGFLSEYDEKARREARSLIKGLDLDRKSVAYCHAGASIDVAKQVLGLLAGSRWYDIGLCLGTKPHAIGVGMAALADPTLTVVCRTPVAYVESETPATGHSWIYEVMDRSAGMELRGRRTSLTKPILHEVA